jgi:hypothetical protein
VAVILVADEQRAAERTETGGRKRQAPWRIERASAGVRRETPEEIAVEIELVDHAAARRLVFIRDVERVVDVLYVVGVNPDGKFGSVNDPASDVDANVPLKTSMVLFSFAAYRKLPVPLLPSASPVYTAPGRRGDDFRGGSLSTVPARDRAVESGKQEKRLPRSRARKSHGRIEDLARGTRSPVPPECSHQGCGITGCG